MLHSEEFRTSLNCRSLLEIFKLTFEDIKQIALETLGPSESVKWCLYRKFSLTSSNFNRIIQSFKRNCYPISLFNTLLGTCSLEGVKSIEWGKTHEKHAIQEFEKNYNFHVSKTGV